MAASRWLTVQLNGIGDLAAPLAVQELLHQSRLVAEFHLERLSWTLGRPDENQARWAVYVEEGEERALAAELLAGAERAAARDGSRWGLNLLRRTANVLEFAAAPPGAERDGWNAVPDTVSAVPDRHGEGGEYPAPAGRRPFSPRAGRGFN